MKFRNPFVLAPLACGLLFAAGTSTWELSSYGDFLNGRFHNVALDREGRLRLAPRLEPVFSSDQPAIWAIARAADGTIYLGTGHRGRVYRLDARGNSAVYWQADEPEVFALATDRQGVLYAGTSPDGKIYRIQEGKATEYFDPKQKYIWALTFGADGALYAATGGDGKIYRVTGPAQGELWYETGQSNVTSLAVDGKGRLLAGTEPNGILYRVEGKGKAFVLYDASLPEIRAVAAAPDGAIYAAALGGSVRKMSAPPSPAKGTASSPDVSVITTAITVSAETSAQSGVQLPQGSAAAAQPAQTPAQAAILPSLYDVPGVDKSAIYRIAPDHTVETVWVSKEENVYDLQVDAGGVVFTTDQRGRLYRLGTDRKLTLLGETQEGETTRIAASAGGLLAATSNIGKLFLLAQEEAARGNYESPVHDAGSVARWGRLHWRGEAAGKGQVRFQTRTGNTARPDSTWSEWSAPLEGQGHAPILSPSARYIQWRVEMQAGGKESPVLESVGVTYLPQNTPPTITSIQTSMLWSAGSAQPKPSASGSASSTAAYSITVTDSPAAAPASGAGTAAQNLARTGGQKIQIYWQAEDADGDRLSYSLLFRGEGEREWKLVKDELTENSYLLDSDALADGRYWFRVVASDRLANPPESAREASLTSSPVLVDNTPPVCRILAARRESGSIVVEAAAEDAASALRRAEYSVNAGPWRYVSPADGIADSRQEEFRFRIEQAPATEAVVVLRVYDAAENAGLAKAIVP